LQIQPLLRKRIGNALLYEVSCTIISVVQFARTTLVKRRTVNKNMNRVDQKHVAL